MTFPPDLTPDCDNCAALCCIALAFDAGDEFAIDKPAGLPCPHLARHDCTIYDTLTDEGFSGCAAYDCEGAGQRTLALYDGVSWQDRLAILAPMLETFRHLRVLHGLIALMDTARQLPLDAEEEDRWDDLMDRLCPEDLTRAGAEALANGPIRGEIHDFLRELAHHV